jgi:hypothetical protein
MVAPDTVPLAAILFLTRTEPENVELPLIAREEPEIVPRTLIPLLNSNF